MNYKAVKILSEYSLKIIYILFISLLIMFILEKKKKYGVKKIFASPLIITVIPNILVKMQ